MVGRPEFNFQQGSKYLFLLQRPHPLWGTQKLLSNVCRDSFLRDESDLKAKLILSSIQCEG
jgi:hypothetical protein